MRQSSLLQEEALEELPESSEDDEPSEDNEGPNQHQLASEGVPALSHSEINSPSPNKIEAQHSNLPNVTWKPMELKIKATTGAKGTQGTLSPQQALAQIPESPEQEDIALLPETTSQATTSSQYQTESTSPSVTSQPLNLEQTITSDSTTTLESTVLSPKYPEVTPVEQQADTFW